MSVNNLGMLSVRTLAWQLVSRIIFYIGKDLSVNMSFPGSVKSDRYTYLLLVVGTLLTATGFTLSGINMVRGSFPVVAIGFILFVLGYKLCWLAAHDVTSFNEIKASVREVFISDDMMRELNFHALTATGIIMASYGSTEFAQTIVADGSMNPLVSGFIVFTGYMVSHEGVNRVLV